MANYPHIICLNGEPPTPLCSTLNALGIPYKVSEGEGCEILSGGTYIVMGNSAAQWVAEQLGAELNYTFSDSGLPQGAVPLLKGGLAYGGILETAHGAIITLQAGGGEIVAASGEGNRMLLYLAARKELYLEGFAAEKKVDDIVASVTEPTKLESATEENLAAEPVTEEAATEENLAAETITEEAEKQNSLDAFLFYGKTTGETLEKPASRWEDIAKTTEAEATIEEFIKEKPRKVMDASLLADLKDDEPSPKKGKAKGIIFKIVAILIIVGLLGGGGYWFFTKNPKECDKEYRHLASLVTKSEETDNNGMLLKYKALREINKNFTGYLSLPETPYGLPVISASEDTAAGTLFSGKKNPYGTPYTKTDLSGDLPSVIILQGNDQGDGRMFGALNRYLEQDFADKNPTFLFDTNFDTGEWAVFSAFKFQKEPFLLTRESFLNDTLFLEYINNFYSHSATNFSVGALADDTLLLLIAKGESHTTVVAARRLRFGESSENLQQRVIVETATDKTEEKEEETSKKPESSKAESTASSQITESKPTSSKTETAKPKPSAKPPKRPEGMRYEQTGLTTDMDQSIKVQMSNVVTILDVTGLDKKKATSILKDTLGVKVDIKEIESAEKRGLVLKQSVAEGAELSVDIPITLTVSAGLADGKAMVPDLVGNAESNAESILEKYELKLGKITEKESSLEKGTILSQSVEAGSEIAYDTKINLEVSNGKGEVKVLSMPNLKGKTEDEAKSALKSAGLRVGKVKTVTSSKTAGTVVSQECPSGEKIAEGETVGFSISNGSKVNNLTVTNISSWSVTVNGKSYAPGDIIKGDYMDIIPYIVEAEMGGGYNSEALKAQAIAAYCWLLNMGSSKGSAPGVPMKNPTDKAIKAAEAVKGLKVKYGSETAQTYYYAIAAGYSANCKDVWWADISYLRAVVSEGDQYDSGFETTVTYTASELKERVADTYEIDLSGVSKSKWFKITYDENDAYVRSVNIGGKKTVTGSSMRDSLLQYELRSTAFKVKYNKKTDKFTFTVRGYGHGVGMSQVGANYYANKGWDYEKILTHYYPGTTIG